MILGTLHNSQRKLKILLVINAILFFGLAVWDHYEDVSDNLIMDIEIIDEHDYNDFDFPTKIARSIQSVSVEFERLEKVKVLDFLFLVTVPLKINQADWAINLPCAKLSFELFDCTSIFRNAP
jgi:hypothetical protein